MFLRPLLAPLAFLKTTFSTAKAYLINSSSLMAALGAECATTALLTKGSTSARTVSIQDFTALLASRTLTPRPHSTEFSLRLLNHRILLGHDGLACPGATDIVEGFTVIDVSGIHIVNMAFCRCYMPGLPGHHREQLLQHGLFLATLKVPQAAFTFDVLNTFHKLTLQSKIAAYNFYQSLERKTDSANIQNLLDYYEHFLDVMRAYRDLMASKRSGRAHDPSGVKATAPGQCAVECPACPHPGRNLPEGWENATDRRWLYSLIVTMDANFRLKNRDHTVKNDASLGDGWCHWVPSVPFLAYIQVQMDDLEPNLCDSQWHAIDQANTKRSSGYASTGVGGIICGRHGLVRRNGFGDLQKGERYANMDFILFQSLAGAIFRRLLLSYDIACQYSQHLFTRMKQLPSDLQIPDNLTALFDFVIPKFHLYGHGSSCQLRYSINLLPGCAHSDLEDPESWWAHINPISMSMKLMTPWARRETIDDHARGWNWRKITQFGSGLLQGLQQAIEMKARHMSLHSNFSASFPADIVHEWEREVVAWELDPTREPNPFNDRESKQDNMAAIRLELANEEIGEVSSDSVGVGLAAFLVAGMEIEDKQ
ncbi:hypothetical protein BDN71DRAFT_1513111 [Pleurotus eryngii]|uniref:CxC2-like cysteine cluster KDZ transposase-associated domain-containing protein n=1 Tax=Pleurotus eryngii TaxID=5323 RepID=A0A9P5ZIG9_PLEER|nr:hypothetical protein BDN71DRAFT_1513111 [Pleurotus eryngii]